MSLRVMFLCRGSVRDGLGHVMRSRTVARAVAQRALVKIVVVGDTYVDNLLAGRDLDYVVVDHDSHAMRLFQEFAPEVVVLDLMHLAKIDFQFIQQSARTVSLSPIFNCLSEVDVVFHRTSILGKDWAGPLIRSGLKYAVVSESCCRISNEDFQRSLKAEALSVVISMGGTDAANRTLQVLEAIKQVPEKLLLWVLLGEGYAHSYQQLVDSMHGSKHEIILAKTNDSMWSILSRCSLAILTGGTTTYEAVYAGLPSVNALVTKEHFFLIQELAERGTCLCAGYTFEESLSALNGIVGRLNTNRNELLAMRSVGLIDNLGAQRIAQEIQDLGIRTLH